MANAEKVAAVAELAQSLRESDGIVLTEYRGLTVKQLQELRRSLGEGASYAVAKNTLTKIAAREAGVELSEDLLTGPTAIAFIKGDVVEAAKGLRDFAKANTTLVIKGGFLDGKSLDADEVKKLADLESREVLLAKLAGAMKGSLQNAVSLFNAPLAQTARLVAALEAKKAEEAPAADTADEAPVAEAAPADEAAAESASTASDDAGTEG
ncbi:MAG: 50S ribosomal protein L10 [Propionibacteriales bacterium]|nr:50S ribosomal protein L10 [Propionibacteriales bacterium]